MEKKKVEKVERSKPHHRPPPHTSPYPWLVFCNEQSQTFCSITENITSVHSIPELGGKIVQNSCHGWLILSTLDRQFSLWNPITFESIHLPPLERKTTNMFEICVLSSPPSHHDSMLFIFDRDIKSIWFCRIHNHDQCWFKHSYAEYKDISQNSNLPPGRLEPSNYFSSPISCDNKIYAITMGFMLQGILVRFDLNKENRVVIKSLGKLPLPHRQNSWHLRKDLVESCGNLFVIYTDYRVRVRQCLDQVIDMEIHKLDLGSMAWKRETSLRNQAFFLDIGERWCGSLSVICSEALGNQIYFFDKKDCVVYSYHIEDHSLSATSLPCPDQQTLSGLTKWMMPVRSMEIHGKASKNIGKQANKSSEKEAEGREIVEKESNGTKLLDLPLEVLKIIHDRVPTIDYLNLRHASAVCRQVAPPLQFETAISRSENLSNSLCPWLVSLHKDGRLCTLSHPHISDRYNVHVPKELQGAMLWHCKDGWLLVSNSRGDVHTFNFFNPFTKRVEKYKSLEELPLHSFQIAFSAPPTSPNCVIVTVEVCSTGRVLIYICREIDTRGRETWMDVTNNHLFLPTYDNPIFSNGAFYFLGRHANVGVLRLQKGISNWQVIEGPREIDPLFSESFLAERDGQVFLILAYEMGKNVRVLSLDLSTLSWNNVENLGNYTLHVSRSSTLFAVAKTSEAENKIYFPRFYGDRLISYSLSTNSIQCCGTKDSLESYKCSALPLHCGWISPHWS